jgi:hypothetical protein
MIATPPPVDKRPALQRFLSNLQGTPRAVRDTALRGGKPNTDRTRSTFVFGNVFLHLHPVRTHRWSLRWATTMGWASRRWPRS